MKIFIIGFADRQYHREDGPQENWRFLGLMSFSDPIRPNAETAIEKCRLAGVKVILISGDHPVTTCALAKRLRIFSPESETVEDVAIRLGVLKHFLFFFSLIIDKQQQLLFMDVIYIIYLNSI